MHFSTKKLVKSSENLNIHPFSQEKLTPGPESLI